MEVRDRNVRRDRSANHEAKPGRLRPAAQDEDRRQGKASGLTRGADFYCPTGMGLRVIVKRDIVPAIRHVPALIPVALPVARTPRAPNPDRHCHVPAKLVSASSPFSSPTPYSNLSKKEPIFILDHNAKVTATQYWYAYWAGLVIAITLRFAVIREIASGVFRDYPGFKRLGRDSFPGGRCDSAVVAIAIVARCSSRRYHPPSLPGSPVELAASVVQSGLVLVELGFSSYSGLSWRILAYGIGPGLGVFGQRRAGDRDHAGLDRVRGRLRLRLGHHGDLPLLCPDLAGISVGAGNGASNR